MPEIRKKFFISKILKVYLSLLTVLAVFLAGIYVGSGSIFAQGTVFNKSNSELSGKADFNIYWQAWDLIQKKYLKRPVDEKNLLYGSLAGMVAGVGDPYTVFFDPLTTRKFNEEISGTFEGIGLEIGIKNNALMAIAALPGSPSEKAGILAGDRILKINDTQTAGITLEEAISLIRGPKGTKVNLQIERQGQAEPLDIAVVRDLIKVNSVNYRMINEKYGYIQVTQFSEDTDKNFQIAVSELIQKNPKGIILDLRSNPGGYLDTAVKLCGYFILKDKLVVVEDYGNGKKTEHLSKNNVEMLNYPTVVLVNGGSASASEIVAGALQDHKVAKIVGEKTFGKGTVQELESFKDGSSLKITVAQWLTPNGRSIADEGIVPDITIALTADDYNNNKDPQLDKALEVLAQ